MEKVVAKIERYVFHNKENSYSIIKALTTEEVEVTLVGYIPLLSEDVFYEFFGEEIVHEKFGKQIKVESFSQSSEQSEEGLISYLSSSLFHGVGPKTASLIVSRLGKDAISKITNDYKILFDLGFKDDKAKRLYEELLLNQLNENTLVKLYSYNISGKMAMKILNKYGSLTLTKLENNPYDLIKDVDGIGFIKADEIASKMNLELTDSRRVKAAIIYSVETYSFNNGDIYLHHEDLIKYTKTILDMELNIDSYIQELINEGDLIKEEDRYYLYSSYESEVSIANSLDLIKSHDFESVDISYLETLLSKLEIEKNIEYTKLQKEAIINSLNNKISIITGGPGTGKTTIIDGILNLYAFYNNINLKKEDSETKIGLMAPTGRAAKRMQEVLDFKAMTIHRHLGYGYDGYFNYDKHNQMPYDLIIIDEASMIDTFLAKKLFETINAKTQVIIVGDVDQLPSVSPGNVLNDIIDSKVFNVYKLKEIHRQAMNSNIIKLATSVNNMNLEHEELNSGNDLFLKNSYQTEIKEIIVSQIEGALKEGYDIINDIQVLIPTYRGDLGIDSVNELLQDRFNKNKQHFITYGDKKYYKGDKVIQLVNDPKNFIMNGDIGYIKDIIKTDKNKEVVLIDFLGQEVMYEKSDLDQINLAYAMSIHKSQGSEYKIVLLPLVRSYMHMLKKQLLYTAITRAKNFLIVLGDMNMLVYAANNLAENRKTTLSLRIRQKIKSA